MNFWHIGAAQLIVNTRVLEIHHYTTRSLDEMAPLPRGKRNIINLVS